MDHTARGCILDVALSGRAPNVERWSSSEMEPVEVCFPLTFGDPGPSVGELGQKVDDVGVCIIS